MKRGAPGAADMDLAGLASKLGKSPISPRQVERWRETGCLPKLKRTPLPGGGSLVSYPERSAEHAVALGKALRESGRRLDEAVLICFAQGFAPREGVLQRSYRSVYGRLRRQIDATAPPNATSWDKADALAARLSRRSATNSRSKEMRARLKDAQAGAGLTDVLTNIAAVFLGTGARPQLDTLNALGLQGIVSDKLGEFGPVSDLGSLGESSSFGDEDALTAFERLVTTAAEAQLEEARDDLLTILHFTAAFSSVTNRVLGFDFGFGAIAKLGEDPYSAAVVGVPSVLNARLTDWTSETDELLAEWQEMTPAYEARLRILDLLAVEYHSILGMQPDDIDQLPEDVWDGFRAAIEKVKETNAADIEAAT